MPTPVVPNSNSVGEDNSEVNNTVNQDGQYEPVTGAHINEANNINVMNPSAAFEMESSS